MKLYPFNQYKNRNILLDYFDGKKVKEYCKEEMIHKVTQCKIIEVNIEFDLKKLNIDCIFSGSFFPSNIISIWPSWVAEERPIQTGDTIVQQLNMPPLDWTIPKIIFGSRVKEVYDGSCKRGFCYETLEGHIEVGSSSITIEKTVKGVLHAQVETFSKPGNWLARLLGPVFSIPYQAYCARKSVECVRDFILQNNKFE